MSADEALVEDGPGLSYNRQVLAYLQENSGKAFTATELNTALFNEPQAAPLLHTVRVAQRKLFDDTGDVSGVTVLGVNDLYITTSRPSRVGYFPTGPTDEVRAAIVYNDEKKGSGAGAAGRSQEPGGPAKEEAAAAKDSEECDMTDLPPNKKMCAAPGIAAAGLTPPPRPDKVELANKWMAEQQSAAEAMDTAGGASSSMGQDHPPEQARVKSPRPPEITRDHPRSPEITRDHPRSPEIARDHPRPPETTRDHARSLEITRGRGGPYSAPERQVAPQQRNGESPKRAHEGMDEDSASSNAAGGRVAGDNQLPYELTGVEESDLAALPLQKLREMCAERNIKVADAAHRATCARELLAWRDGREQGDGGGGGADGPEQPEVTYASHMLVGMVEFKADKAGAAGRAMTQLYNYIEESERNQRNVVPISCVINFGKPGDNGELHLRELVVGHRRSKKSDGKPDIHEPPRQANAPGFRLKQVKQKTGYEDEEFALLEAVISAAAKVRKDFQMEGKENMLRDRVLDELRKREPSFRRRVVVFTKEKSPGAVKKRYDLGLWIKKTGT